MTRRKLSKLLDACAHERIAAKLPARLLDLHIATCPRCRQGATCERREHLASRASVNA